jgi:hypothetical protein
LRLTAVAVIADFMSNDLISDIDKFLAATGLSGSRFGVLAAKNGRLVERLRSGGRVWPETEQLIRDFIKSEGVRRSIQDKAA